MTVGGLDIYGKPMIAMPRLRGRRDQRRRRPARPAVALTNYDTQSNIQLYSQFASRRRQGQGRGGAWRHHLGVARGDPADLERFKALYFYNTLYEGGVCDRNTFCTGTTPAQTVEKLVPT